MKYVTSIFIFITSLAVFSQEDAQRVFHKQFTKEDGLNIETINTIAQNNNGCVLLGGGITQVRLDLLGETQPTTLQRFNFYSFHTIALPDNDLSSVKYIHKRKNGDFYVLTEQSLYLFNLITTSFKKIVSP